MIEFVLVLLVVLFSGFDFQTTRRRLGRFGLQAELNPAVQWLAAKLGITWGVAIAVLGPMIFWSSLFLAQGWDLALAFYAGMKGQLVYAQALSQGLEQKIAEEMGLSSNESDDGPPPSEGA